MAFPDHETKESPSPCFLERLMDKALFDLENVNVGVFETNKKRLENSLEAFRAALHDSHFDMASATVEMMICSLQMAQNSHEVGIVLTPRHLRGVMVQADAELRRRSR